MIRYLVLSYLLLFASISQVASQNFHADQKEGMSEEAVKLVCDSVQVSLKTEDWSSALRQAMLLRGYYGSMRKMDSMKPYHQIIDTVAFKLNDIPNHIDGRLAVIYQKQRGGKFVEKFDEEMDYLAKFIDNPEVMMATRADISYVVSCYYYDTEQYDEGLKELQRAIELSDQQTEKEFTQIHFRLEMSRKFNQYGKYNEAIEVLLEAEKLAKKQEAGILRELQIAESFAMIFMNIGDADKAITYLQEVVRLAKIKNYKSFINRAYMKMGTVYERNDDVDLGRSMFLKVLPYYRNKGTARSKNAIYHRLANNYIMSGDLKTAGRYLDSARMQIPKGTNVFSTDGFNLTSARYACETGSYSKALTEIKNATQDRSTYNIKNGNFELLKAKVLKKLGRYEQALDAFEVGSTMRDSTRNSNQLVRVQRLESEFNRKQQDVEISALNETTAAQEKSLEVRNIALILGSIMLLVLAGLLYGLYRLFVRYRANQEELAKQNIVVTEALQENQILLKEIHHRVKNNLQVISSLLSMQARKVGDAETKDALNSSKTRVQSMSILHQNLYQTDNLKGVDVDTYIEQLVDNIIDTYNVNKDIKIDIDIDKTQLDVDTLVPIGLVANELICNALKYAFVGVENPLLKISMKTSGNQITLRVADNGVGFEGDQLPMKEGSLGARLITSFTKRLDGEIFIDKSEGTDISIILNRDEA